MTRNHKDKCTPEMNVSSARKMYTCPCGFTATTTRRANYLVHLTRGHFTEWYQGWRSTADTDCKKTWDCSVCGKVCRSSGAFFYHIAACAPLPSDQGDGGIQGQVIAAIRNMTGGKA
jgi:hypothetical protein